METLLLNSTATNCLSVSQLTEAIRSQLESFPSVYVQGEISNFTAAYASGHWYFTLKDNTSQIKAVMFRSANEKVQNWQPQSGEEVRVRGKLGVYGPRGEYQLICRNIEKCGKGALHEQFERIKQKLKEEGLFDRKRPIPFLPKHIAIITSPKGAAIRDILNILKRRYKGVKITLIGALVQGELAPADLIDALSKAQKLSDIDVLIITRGGGSLEDLWAFNNEELARNLFAFPKPVISAVGHEVDFTICDFISDLRAPTPSAAAELVVQNAQDLIIQTKQMKNNLYQSILRKLKNLGDQLRGLEQGLTNPAKKLQDLQQYLDELNTRMKQTILQQNILRDQKLQHLKDLLNTLSPLKVLKRGYSLVSRGDQIIKDSRQLKPDDELHLRFGSGFALARTIKTINSNKGELKDGV